MKVQFLGHAAFYIELNGTKLMIDPFISGNPKAKDIDLDAFELDFILITHGHGDHIGDAEYLARKTGALIVSNYEIVNWFKERGLEAHPLNHGGKWDFGFATIKYVQATHTSSLPDGSYGGNPGGFVVWTESTCFYHAGDTGLTMDMKLIPMLCPKLDLAILPIGDNYTMGPEEAVVAAEFVDCRLVIPCHFDTSDLIKVDKDEVSQLFKSKGKEIKFLEIGQMLEING